MSDVSRKKRNMYVSLLSYREMKVWLSADVFGNTGISFVYIEL